MTITELRVELRKSKKENVTLVENQPKRKLKNIPIEVSKFDKEIMILGRQYSIMTCPWVDISVFQQSGRPNIDPLSPDRYKTTVSRRDGNIAEMYDLVLKKLHKLMENHSHFGDLVSAAILMFLTRSLTRPNSSKRTRMPCDLQLLIRYEKRRLPYLALQIVYSHLRPIEPTSKSCRIL